MALAALLAPSLAWPLGFGVMRAQVVLGQPLNVAVPVSLGDGESLGAECASAEVTAGDVRLAAGLVRVRVTQGRDANEAVIRIVTTVPIEEPVLQVAVGAGCPPRINRALTLLADPPMAVPVVASAAADAPLAPVRATEPGLPVGGAPSAPGPATTTVPAPRRATRPALPARATRTAVEAGAPATAPSAEPSQARVTAPVARRPENSTRSRLVLDSSMVANRSAAAVQAAEAQAAAASAAAAVAAEAASAAERRMKDLEAELARVRADAKAQTEALLQLRQQIAQDQAARERQAVWIPYLLAGVGVLALVAGWLAWRLRQLQAAPRRDAWWDRSRTSELSPPSQAADSAFAPASEAAAGRSSIMGSRPGALATPVVTEHGALDSVISPSTVAVPPAVTTPPAREDESARAMSVDEQIDLEQQADFFIALGHDDAAIDLLMAHLRSTGGGTPLPFLKLLEIHRRRGDLEAYERTRVRFNQRFNSVAPDWNTDPKSGRTLEDYPLTISRLQHAWSNPLDAMAELEALLFRRGTGAELFELPAYQEVLFLYQLARDLNEAEHPASAGSAVDVLLPISDAPAAVPEGMIPLRPEFDRALDLDLSTTPGVPDLSTGGEPALPKITLDLDAAAPDGAAGSGQGGQAGDEEDKDRRNG